MAKFKRLRINGQRLSYYMAARGKNAKMLAAEIGCSTTTISNYLSGETNPSEEAIIKIAKALEINMDSLLKETHLSAKASGEARETIRKALNNANPEYLVENCELVVNLLTRPQQLEMMMTILQEIEATLNQAGIILLYNMKNMIVQDEFFQKDTIPSFSLCYTCQKEHVDCIVFIDPIIAILFAQPYVLEFPLKLKKPGSEEVIDAVREVLSCNAAKMKDTFSAKLFYKIIEGVNIKASEVFEREGKDGVRLIKSTDQLREEAKAKVMQNEGQDAAMLLQLLEVVGGTELNEFLKRYT